MVEQAISYIDMTRRINKKRPGDLLLDQKMITENQLDKALEIQHIRLDLFLYQYTLHT